MDALVRISRERTLTRDWLQLFFRCSLSALKDQVDASRHEPMWRSHGGLALTPDPRTKRVARVSHLLKEALAATVATKSRLKTTGALVAASSALANARGPGSAVRMASGCTARFRSESAFHYLQQCRAALKSVDQIAISLDGVSVSGEHVVPMLFWAPQLEKLLFAPPAVSRGVEKRTSTRQKMVLDS